MVIRNYHWLNSASRVLISTCSAPLVQTGERKQFSLFDLDLWPTTLTYNHRLAKVKVDPHTKNQGHRSNGSNRRVPIANWHTHTHGQTDGRTHGRYQTYHLPCYAVDKNINKTYCPPNRHAEQAKNVTFCVFLCCCTRLLKHWLKLVEFCKDIWPRKSSLWVTVWHCFREHEWSQHACDGQTHADRICLTGIT